MKKKILITGSSGFIAKHFIRIFKNKYTFILYDRKKNGDLSLKKKFPKADYVLHLAALCSTKDFYLNPNQVIQDNISPTLNLINFYGKNYPKTKFIFTGTPESISGSVEKLNYKIPTDEKAPIYIDDLNNKRWSYALSKAVCEQIVMFGKLKFVIIRPHNLYGPNQKNHFIPEFLERAEGKKSVELFGYKNKRCWLYIDDFCDALEKLMSCKRAVGEVVNIGSNFEKSTYDVAKIMLKLKYPNRNIRIIKRPAPKGSAMRRMPSINKVKSLINWKPKTNLKTGLSFIINAK